MVILYIHRQNVVKECRKRQNVKEKNMSKTRVFIADDNERMVNSLTDLINKQNDMEVVGTAFDGVKTVEKIELIKPDVCLIDIIIPGLDGLGFVSVSISAFLSAFRALTPLLRTCLPTLSVISSTLILMAPDAADTVISHHSFLRHSRSCRFRDFLPHRLPVSGTSCLRGAGGHPLLRAAGRSGLSCA